MSAPYTRQTNDPRVTNVGAELTYQDGDDNLIYILDKLDSLADISGLTPYNPSTTYTGGVTYIVGYNGVAYLFISSTDQTGVTPLGNPLVWQPVSNAVLLHQQNTDTYLNFGGTNQVSAAELKALLNQFISITSTQFFILRDSASALEPNRIYYLTDLKLIVQTFASTNNSDVAHLLIVVPNYSAAPLWATGTVTIGELRSWNGLVWSNLTGTNTGATPNNDATNWAVDAVTYIQKIVRCQINEIALNIINISDGNGNVHPYSAIIPMLYAANGTYLQNNIIDKGSIFNLWNLTATVRGNTLKSYSSVLCTDILLGTRIADNSLQRAAINFLGTNTGVIELNEISYVNLNIQSGFTGNILASKISLKSNSGITGLDTIRIRAAADLQNVIINTQGSNALDTINVSATTTLNLAANGFSDAYGEVMLSGTIGTINLIGNYHNLYPVNVRVPLGSTLILTVTPVGSVSASGQIISSTSGSITLVGNNKDYFTIRELRTLGAGSIVNYIEIHKSV
jgi:hypothetical protein